MTARMTDSEIAEQSWREAAEAVRRYAISKRRKAREGSDAWKVAWHVETTVAKSVLNRAGIIARNRRAWP